MEEHTGVSYEVLQALLGGRSSAAMAVHFFRITGNHNDPSVLANLDTSNFNTELRAALMARLTSLSRNKQGDL